MVEKRDPITMDDGFDFDETKAPSEVEEKPVEDVPEVKIKATLDSRYPLKWQNEIDLHTKINTTIILEGNVNDKQIYIDKDNQVAIKSTEKWLYDYLHEIGYNTVIFFNHVQGFYWKKDKSEYERFLKLVKSGEKNMSETELSNNSLGSDTSLFGGESIGDILAAMRNTKEAVAVVMTDVSRYISKPDSISDLDHYRFSRLSLATKHIVGPAKSEIHNILFLITEKVNDIPAWFYLSNPLVKTITVPLPDLNIRKMYIDAYYDNFPEAEGETESDIEKNKETFVAYTDNFMIVDLDSLRNLMTNENIPVSKIAKGVNKFKYGTDENPWEDENLRKELSNIEDKLKERVKGQDAAIKKASAVIKSAVLGLAGLQHSSSKSKPRGILFLAGPTGVGKTELAKAISEWLFKTEERVIRFDMSEYSQSHTDQKLLGAPPGYVGYEQGGQLTEAVKRNPFSVLLFDEIEKAHPTILDKFLQILEDGRMTDGKGETVYFSDTLIIFTSNLGMYEEVRDKDGFITKKETVLYDEDGCNEEDESKSIAKYDSYSKKILNAINYYFTIKIERPEIKNRIGENFVVFDFISYDAARKIADKQIDKIKFNLKNGKNIILNLEDEAKNDIFMELIKDEHIKQGGRGVGNVIENMVIRPLSDYLVNHMIFDNATINIKSITKTKGGFVFND